MFFAVSVHGDRKMGYHRLQKMTAPTFPSLDEQTLVDCVQTLAQQEPFFAHIIAQIGPPPLWQRPTGFPTLVWIILEQQVSLASARAAFERLKQLRPALDPQQFLELSDAELKWAGFSRQKTGYCRDLAQAILHGEIDLESLAHLEDEAARNELMRLKGVGPWTADIYLLMALLRYDIWPAQDRALVIAVQRGLKLDHIPDSDEMTYIGKAWRPYRSIVARLFWHYYLNFNAKNLAKSA
jgi:DNA-3-methyladenine glycosylase II